MAEVCCLGPSAITSPLTSSFCRLQAQSKGIMHAHPASCAVALALLLASISSSNAFLPTPSLAATACRQHHQQGTCGSLAMTAETPSSSESSSRKAFFRQGATAVAASWGLVAAAVASPAPSLAKDIGGIDVRGIDVAEMLHPGAGGGSGKASSPLRDCLLNVERVRVSTKQVRT